MIRVVLIDQPEMLTGLTLLLSNEPDIDVQGTYTAARQALARLGELLPDVLITDQHPRDMNLVELTAAAIQATSVRVLVLVTSIVDSDVGRRSGSAPPAACSRMPVVRNWHPLCVRWPVGMHGSPTPPCAA